MNYTESIIKRISEIFVKFTDVFVVNSMPTPICKYARGGRSKICYSYKIKPTFDYYTAQKSKYFGFK